MKKAIITLVLMQTFLFATENSVRVSVTGFRNDSGTAIVYFYRPGMELAGEGFVSKQAVIVNGSCTFEIQGIPDGDYAVRVLHDANSNGKMDVGLSGLEGVGVSRNKRLKGHPKFDEIRVHIDKDKRAIGIMMQYISLGDIIAGGMHHGK